jgi:hypothetical protein
MCLTRRPEGLLDAEMELPPVRQSELHPATPRKLGRLLQLDQAKQPTEINPRPLLPTRRHRELHMVQARDPAADAHMPRSY